MNFLRHLSGYLYVTFLLVSFCCAQSMRADEVRHHLVRPGDTYYSLARYYQVSVDALMAANPESGTTLVCGTTLLIPVSGTSKLDSTVSSTASSATVSTSQSGTSSLASSVSTMPSAYSSSAMRVALILPLRLDQATSADKQRARNVELYQGFLMAVDSIQRHTRGYFDLTVYDSSNGLATILGDDSFAQTDLIVSTVEKADAQQLAVYAEQHSIPLVLPFVYDATWHDRYPHTYQLNTPKAQTYDVLTREVLSRFEDYTPVFLVDSLELDKTDDYTVRLRSELTKRGKDFYTFGYSDPADVGRIDSLLPLGSKVLYVPVTSGRGALRRMFPYMQFLRQRYADDAFAMLGTPEWQLYTDDFIEFYYSLDVYIYSKIYVNPFADDVRSFYTAFKRWYGCDPMPLYPKYALTGYDMGLYFLTAVSRSGRQFGAGIGASGVSTLQSAINLRSEGKGYMNRGVYLIHFTPQMTIEKYDLH